MRRIYPLSVPSLVLCSAALLAACGASAEEQDATRTATAAQASELAHNAAPAAGPNVVQVVTTEYTFEAPDTLPAGYTTFHLVDRGAEPHHIWLVRLEQGRTLDDLMQAMQANPHAVPAWAKSVGGPNTPMPGGEASATVLLEPGSYAMVCVIPAPDGVPHVAKGMVHPLTVVPSQAGGAPPAADVEMTLTDYDFQLSRPIAAGRQTLRVENRAAQDHELIVMRLAPGRTLAEAVAWFETLQGPPPGEFLGGVTGLATGTANETTIDFAPGDYALICMVPDARDGKPHVMHGMAKQIRVS